MPDIPDLGRADGAGSSGRCSSWAPKCFHILYFPLSASVIPRGKKINLHLRLLFPPENPEAPQGKWEEGKEFGAELTGRVLSFQSSKTQLSLGAGLQV